jgi:UDP-N-acetylmuramoyl-tripeptide--D-alanyl-D-alanine ligase
VGSLTLILDCYNASPASVAAGLDLLAELPARTRRVAILGSMLEMGPRELEIHQETLLEALDRPLDLVVASGLFAAAADQLRLAGGDYEGSERVLVTHDPMGSFGVLRPRLRGDEVVLIKGSRGIALERLVPLFEEAFGESGATAGAGAGEGGA